MSIRLRAGSSVRVWTGVLLLLLLGTVGILGVIAQIADAAVVWDARMNAAVYDTIRGRAGTGGAEYDQIMRDLTGTDEYGNPVVATIHGQPYDFGATAYCRWQRGPQPEFGENGITMAQEYVREYFEKQGLDEVVKQKWHGIDDTYHPAWGGGTRVDGTQVIGEITGETKPKQIILVCGHLDSVAYDGILPMDFLFAPGANDNLAAAAATMICARELAPYEFQRTIRFACWGGEEQGCLGSWNYARKCRKAGEKIVGVVNLEMIAWDYRLAPIFKKLDASTPLTADEDAYLNGSWGMDVHTRKGKIAKRELAMWRTFRDVVSTYGVLLKPRLRKDAQDYSDQISFWHYGYPTISVEEQIDPSDELELRAYPYYHTVNDTLANCHVTYMKRIASAAVGTVGTLAQIMEPGRASQRH